MTSSGEDEYRQLFAANPVPMLIYERGSLALVAINEAFERLYGYRSDELPGLGLLDLYPATEHAALRRLTSQLHGLANVGEWQHLRRDGSRLQVVVQSHDVRYAGRDCRMAVITDITPLQRAKQRDRIRLSLLENLARGDSLASLLAQLARDHEALFPDTLCGILLLDAASGCVAPGAAPSLPADYVAVFAGQPIGAGLGCCGEAMHSGQRVIARDLASHPNWQDWRALTAAAGLRACWAEPILGAGGQVLGSFASYRRQPGEPGPEELAEVGFAVKLAATAIHHAATAANLRDSERRLGDILRAIPDLVWLKDGQGMFRNCNAALEQLLALPAAQILGRHAADVTGADTAAALDAGDAAVVASGQPHTAENWINHARTGRPALFQTIKTPLFDGGGRLVGVLGVARDITAAQRDAQRIQRLNRAYAVLSEANEAVVRLRDPQQLWAEVCRIGVVVGGLRVVWAGQISDDGCEVLAITHAGHSDGFVEALRAPLNPPQGPAAIALSSGLPCVVNDIASDPRTQHLREAARQRGYGSAATFPVLIGGQARHCLCVCAQAAGHFDADQVALLSRLAQDLGHALDFINTQAAQRREQRFRAQLIESVAGLFYVIDSRGKLLLWNRQLEESSGLSGAELAERSALDFFEGSERRLLARRLRQVLAQGQAQAEGSPSVRDGRPTRYLFVSRRVDSDSGDGNPGEPLIVGTGIDITDRVHDEQELARHRQQLEALVARRTAELEAVNVRLHREDQRLRAMLSLSQQASALTEQQLFQHGIDEAARQTGSAAGCVLSGSDVVPQRQLTLQAWASASPEPLRAALTQAAADQLPWQRCLASAQALFGAGADSGAAPAAGGGLPLPHLLCVPITDDGQAQLVLCVAGRATPYGDDDARELQLVGNDLWRIVRRRRIETALQRAKHAADAANQAKSAFLANMSHEIRTPMNAIVGFAHLLKRDPLTPRQLDSLGKIGDASQHLLQVINDVLDFSKIEAHKIALEAVDFTLRDCLERVRTMVGDRARIKQVALAVDTGACPPRLRGDRLRLEQILLNLLGNAVKFTHQGSVVLRVMPITGDSAPAAPGTRLRFEIEDTGIGMRESQIPHLFEAFEQADASTTRRFGGTGLGLAICKRLAELMGGCIGVVSRLGLGSTFWFELPFEPPLQPAPPVAAAPARWPARPLAAAPGAALAAHAVRLHGTRVLLAEDNPINQEVASALLQALGAQVDVADDGEAAVRMVRAQAQHQRYDLVLMDVQMPVMDGLRATRLIRAMPDLPTLPIIAMTANAFDDDRLQCLAAGMDDYLAKPVEPQALLDCLLRWLRDRPPTPGDAPSPAGASSTAELQRQQLESVAGVQLTPALARMRGNWPLYLRTLQLFVQHHGADVALLQPGPAADAAATMDDTLARWRQVAHSVAGAAATLGALTLAHRAQALQAALAPAALGQRQAVPLPAQLAAQALAEALGGFLAAIQAVLDTGAVVTAPVASVDWAAVAASLRALQPLLASHDTSAADRLEPALALLQAALGPLAGRLEQQVQTFSFEDALQTLTSALQLADAALAGAAASGDSG